MAASGAGAAGDRGWPSLALDSRGTAHAIWLDHRGLAAARRRREPGTTKAAAHDGVAMAQKSGLYYAAARARRPTERELAKGVCYCCKTALAAGADQAVYAAWRHVYPGNIRDIAFTVSRDGGRSFAAPIRVSEDTWAINGCPDDGPAIAVDAQGKSIWRGRRWLAAPNPEGALFYASTRDGRTFTPRTRSPRSEAPKPAHPQIVVDRRGRIVVAWDELLNGQRLAAAREVSKSGQRVNFGPVITLSPGKPATYPRPRGNQLWRRGGLDDGRRCCGRPGPRDSPSLSSSPWLADTGLDRGLRHPTTVSCRRARRPARLASCWSIADADRLTNAYGMYLVHYAIVTWVQYALLPAPWPGLVKAAVAFGATVALSWLATAMARRVALHRLTRREPIGDVTRA